jgi:hypothetical protein
MKTIFIVNKNEINSKDYPKMMFDFQCYSKKYIFVENRINLQYHIIKLKTV